MKHNSDLGAISLSPGSSEPSNKDEFSTEVKDQNSISPSRRLFDRGTLDIQDNGILLFDTENNNNVIQDENSGIIDVASTSTDKPDRFIGKFLLLLLGASGIFLYSLIKK